MSRWPSVNRLYLHHYSIAVPRFWKVPVTLHMSHQSCWCSSHPSSQMPYHNLRITQRQTLWSLSKSIHTEKSIHHKTFLPFIWQAPSSVLKIDCSYFPYKNRSKLSATLASWAALFAPQQWPTDMVSSVQLKNATYRPSNLAATEADASFILSLSFCHIAGKTDSGAFMS